MPLEDTHVRLMNLIVKRLGKEPSLEDSFGTIDLDSLAMAELSLAIEKEFGIRLSEDVLDVRNITDLVAFVDKEVEKKTKSGS